MQIQIKPSFLFYTFTLFVCLNSFFLENSAAQVSIEPIVAPAGSDSTFESIDVPGADFLALTTLLGKSAYETSMTNLLAVFEVVVDTERLTDFDDTHELIVVGTLCVP